MKTNEQPTVRGCTQCKHSHPENSLGGLLIKCRPNGTIVDPNDAVDCNLFELRANTVPTTVREATVLGENCGACDSIFSYIFDTGGSYRIIHACAGSQPCRWDRDFQPINGLAPHPPGRSVCPEFEAME